MNIREIRIGNTIHYLETRNPDKWETINVSPETYGRIIVEPERFSGIPLTPTMLERLGFTGNIDEGFELDAVELNYITTDDHFEFEYKTSYKAWMIVPIKHLHQLQNLYFSLTDKELTLDDSDEYISKYSGPSLSPKH